MSILVDLHSGTGSIAEPTYLPKASFRSKNSIYFSNPTQILPFRTDLHPGLAEWASLHKDILVLIAEHFDFFEDFFSFSLVCKAWQSVASVCKKSSRTLPPRYPWVMLTDIAEKNFPKATREDDPTLLLVSEIEKNEHIEGMNKRRFFSFSRSKTYEFELPEATRRKCLGVGNGWLMTIGYDSQINLFHPFSRQQVGLPSLLSFQTLQEICEFYERKLPPQARFGNFVNKAIMSCNPYDSDCIVLAIYTEYRILAFARPGDKVWTDIYPRYKLYRDVIYYKGKFYAIVSEGVVVVCDIDNVKVGPTTTPIACIPERLQHCSDSRWKSKYLVESSDGSLMVVVRFRKGPSYYDARRKFGIVDKDDAVHLEDDDADVLNYTVGFSIFKMEESLTGDGSIYDPKDDHYDLYDFPTNLRLHRRNEEYPYPYKLTPVNNLGDNALFLGHNVSVSLPASSDNNVKANHIYFSEDETLDYRRQPYGGGRDTGIYDVKTGKIIWHYASKFVSRLTPPMWYI